MNIQDAIKSGKPFRPVGGTDWFESYQAKNFKFIHLSEDRSRFKFTDFIDYSPEIILGDWELKQEPKKVTLYQYLLKRSDGIFFITDWSSQDKNDRCNNSSFEILKTFTREIEL